MTLTPGSRIGQYQIRELLGVGGMGEVYRAHDLRLGREVALKTLSEAFVADPDRIARFEREARLLATLSHPNIATIHGLEQAGEATALVMELIDGQSLEDRLRRQLPLEESLAIARQLVEALDAAHEKGVVHRDLKPANIKLTTAGTVKVLDFGLAKMLEPLPTAGSDPKATLVVAADLTQAGMVLGTPAYMSPEQARGLPVDRRTDIWAFGAILYEMLAGRPVFTGPTASDILAAVLKSEIRFDELPGSLPADLRGLVEHCLQRNPKARLRDIADAAPALEGSGRPLPNPPVAGDAPVLSRRMLVIGAASAAVGLGLGFGAGRLLAPAAAPSAPAPTPSFQRLTYRRGLIRTARFGPDFRTVYYGALWDGDVCRVYVVRPESAESAPLSLPPGAPLAVSSRGELALSLGDHFRGVMTYGTLASVPLAGGAPRELQERVKYGDWSPDGLQLAIVRGDGQGDRLEFPVGTVIAGGGSSALGFSFPRVSADGTRVAAFELDDPDSLFGKAVVYDRSGRQLAASAPYYNVFGLAWNGDEVWFTAADALPLFRNTVYGMDASGAVRTVARVPGNTTLHDTTPDGRLLIARTDDRAGITLRLPGQTAEQDLSWLDAPYLADISADGTRILFSEFGVGGGPEGSVYVRATDGSPAIRLASGSARALSPDGRWAIVKPSSEARHLELIPTGAGETRRLEQDGMRLFDARSIPGSRAFLVRASEGDGAPGLYVLDAERDTASAVTPPGHVVGYDAWVLSPDGATIAVAGTQGPLLFPVSGGQPRPIPGGTSAWQVVGWIHAGLLVSENPASAGVVWLVDPVSGQRKQWADIQPRDPAAVMGLNLNTLVVTPDGGAYGYNWHRATSDLYLVEGWS